ncbi:MAG: dihydroorotate dehydrogenase (quinone), partial [Prochlorothrix sp.]
KITPLEQAIEDYCASFRLLEPWGSYFVVNVSSPNTPGLRSLQATAALDPLLAALQQENTRQLPLFVKISPDLDGEAMESVVDLAQRHHLAGLIATNTTIGRTGLRTQRLRTTGSLVAEEAGGISGAPLRDRSTAVVRFLWEKSQGQVPIIGVGGVANAAQAWAKISAGASLVQLYTAWIYGGPGLLRQMLQGLGQRLDRLGMATIQEAIGSQEPDPLA